MNKLPENVKDVVKDLIKDMSEKDRDRLKDMSEKKLITLHHGFGTYIRNSFGLWTGNKELLSDCFRILRKYYSKDYSDCLKFYASINVDGRKKIHPDDASMVIIKELCRTLREGNNVG